MAYKIDSNMLEKLRALSEDELRKLIYALAKHAGAGDGMAAMLSSNAPNFKRKLMTISAEDLTKALSSVPADALEKIARGLK